MDETKAIQEKISFIKIYDPDGAARLERLLSKRETLKQGNLYCERFTDRQFSLVFIPLLDAAIERAKILELLARGEDTVPGLSERLNVDKDKVFKVIRELMRKNLVGITGHSERHAVFKIKTQPGIQH